MRFLFTCGGTGGHINPAVAAAQRLKTLMPDCEILFLGTADNMEMDLVPREGFPIRAIPAGNLHRSMKPREIAHNLRSGTLLLEGIRQAREILRDFRPAVVMGTGGYVCCPVLIATSRLGIPTLLHEANALPGLTTRLLEKHTDQLMVAFEESRAYYRQPEKVICPGMPVRSGFRDRDRAMARRSLGIPEDLPLILSFGGSLGAARMNEALAVIAAEQERHPRFRLLHATGGGQEGLENMRRRMGRETGIHPAGALSLRYARGHGGGGSGDLPGWGIHPGRAGRRREGRHPDPIPLRHGEPSGEERGDPGEPGCGTAPAGRGLFGRDPGCFCPTPSGGSGYPAGDGQKNEKPGSGGCAGCHRGTDPVLC